MKIAIRGPGMKLRLFISLLLLLFSAGCTRDVSVFESTIYTLGDDVINVDCSEEVNRNRENHTDEGYHCEVLVTETTSLRNKEGGAITLDELKTDDLIRITLKKPLNISKNNRSFAAKEIVLLDQ
jgi:aspartate carbamoyltransferase catalytic subunit